jgi:hypothetical protein
MSTATTPVKPDPSTPAAPARSRRRLARIERRGLSIVITPARCATALAHLVGCLHVYDALDEVTRGMVVKTYPHVDRTTDRGEQVLACAAGLEPVVRRLLRRAGYRTRVTRVRRPLGEPDLDRVRRHGTPDLDVLALVGPHDRGVVRYDGRHVDPAWLAAQVALAFPRAPIAVIAARVNDVKRLAARLRRTVPETCYGTCGSRLPRVSRVVVATPWALRAPVARLWLRQIILVVDPVAALGEHLTAIVEHAPRARVFGLLERDVCPAPSTRDRLVGLFGLREVIVPRHGHRPRLVAVVPSRVVGGPRLDPDLDTLTLKRDAVWSNPMRNRRVVRIAEALAGDGPGSRRADLAAVAAPLAGVAAPRVAVLVEALEHALALAILLPGWPLLVGRDADATGLGSPRAAALATRRWERPDAPDRAIVTFDGLGRLPLGDLDAVVRADGGAGVPAALADAMVMAREHPRPLVLVDLDDRHHPVLRRWGRRRRDAYAELGWTGEKDPLEAAVDRYLDERAGVAR